MISIKKFRYGNLLLAFLAAFFITACNNLTLDKDLKTFFEEQKGTITLGTAAPLAGKLAVGTDGYICLAAGEEGFTLPVNNPLGYALVVESSFNQTVGGGISGVTVSQADANTLLTFTMPTGVTEGNEGTLHIKIKTAEEGRTLYEGDIGIAYVSFETTLKDITLSDGLALTETFDANRPNYSLKNAPESFSLTATAKNSAAFITVDGATRMGILTHPITTNAMISEIKIEVYTRHRAAVRTYLVVANRGNPGESFMVVSKNPDKMIYALNESFDPTSIKISLDTGAEVEYSQCTASYDFSSPGYKKVTFTHKTLPTLKAEIFVWVVGMNALTVTGTGFVPSLSFNSSTFAYSLGDCPVTTTSLTVTAGIDSDLIDGGAKLSIKCDTEPETPLTISGTTGSGSGSISLPTGSHAIFITVSLTKEGITKDVTYKLSLFRKGLPESGAELYVAPTGNDANDGTSATPLKTVKKALEMVKASGLNETHEVTIVISGTLTSSTGDTGTTNGMIDISGSVYPKIILKGKGTGADAGILNAEKTKRILYISGGNKVTLGDNLTLTGGTADYGGGVYVTGSSSTFIMNGGSITNNDASSGGGVYVTGSSSTFIMNGGSITNNEASFGGGGVYVRQSSFTMTGGSIDSNKATYNGGGVFVYQSTFEMSNTAVIQSNTAAYNGGGVYVTGGPYVSDKGSFVMTGGTIRDNVAAGTSSATNGGGGVYVVEDLGNFISKNGGMIYGDTNTTHTSGNENTASNGKGHAIYTAGKKRNTNAGAAVILYAECITVGNWTYSGGGLGDTTTAWDGP